MLKRLLLAVATVSFVVGLATPVLAAPPGAVGGLVASVDGTSITVSWSAPADDGGAGIDGYQVSLAGPSAQDTFTTDTSVVFTALAPGDYTASVTPTNIDGDGPTSTSGSVTVEPPVVVPSAPTGVSASVSGQSVTVSWSPPASNGGSPVLDYTVTLSGPSGGQQTVSGTSATFSNRSPGTYTASVTARNSAGSGPAGTSGSVTVVLAPSAPTGVSASVSGQSVTVSWSPPASNGGSAILDYTVTLSGPSGGSSTVTGTSATFSNRSPGSYTASVTARNSAGSGPAGTSGPVTVEPPVTAPSAPTGVSASVSGQSVTVSWSPPASNGGSAILDYTVTLSGPSGGQQTVSGTSATFASRSPGSYTASVTARNSAGSGPAGTSGPVTVEPPVTAPSAPLDVVLSVTGQSVAVLWSPPASNGGSAILDYTVTLSGPSGGQQTVSGTSATFASRSPGSYTASVTARNSAGSGPAGTSNTGSVVIAPSAPGNVAASVSGQTVTVSWSAANNGGDPNLTYTVRLSNGPSRSDITGTSTTFTGVSPGVLTATVTATNSAGTGPSATSASFSVFSAPGSPRNVQSGASGSTIVVTWVEPSFTGNRPLTGYRVELRRGGTLLDTRLPGPGESSASFPGQAPGIYRVVVFAVNDQGSSPPAAADVEVGSLAPSAPGNVRASADVQTITVTWDPPLSPGNTPLVGYDVTLGDVTRRVEVGRSTVFVDVPLGTYTARVRAVNGAGPGLAGESNQVRSQTVFAPFVTAEDLIARQYADFLGRTPDRAGLDYWEGVLGADRTRAPVVIESFMRSPEFRPRRSIARLYLAFFDRSPDRAGFDFWTGVIRRGGTLNDIAAAFAESQEFRNTYGDLTDAEFIALVYNNVLLRTPDLAGFRFWVERLQRPGVTRGDLMVAFSESPEFINKSNPAVDVIMTYRGMLDRAPDPAGFAFWVGEVAGRGDSLQRLINNFFVSEEYSNRVR